MVSNRTMTQIPSQRVARAIQSVNDPVACSSCGSIFFYEVNASMYTSRGRDLGSVSVVPQKVYICLCGKIQELSGYQSASAGSERDFFNQSLKLALEVSKENDVDSLAQKLVGVSEFNKQIKRIDGLESKFNSILTDDPNASISEVEDEEVIEPILDVDPPNPNPQGEAPLVPTGYRGRSEASAVPNLGAGKQIDIAPRRNLSGGAQRLRKQGAQ